MSTALEKYFSLCNVSMNVGPEEECGVSLGSDLAAMWLRNGHCLSAIIYPRLCCSLKEFPGRGNRFAHLPAVKEFVFNPLGGLWQSQGQCVPCRAVPQPGVQCWRLSAPQPALCPLLVSPRAQGTRLSPGLARAGCGMGRLRGWLKALGDCRKQNILSERGQGESQVPRKRTLQGRRR